MVYGCRFLIYDCDNFTKSFYYHTFGVTEFQTVDVKQKLKDLPKMVIDLPQPSVFSFKFPI
ncbi:hypothetical protein DPMN_191680 [Dreissena polymorpha]|uniref:DM10 domain-containing protein n=1 Tax=Dreissena polymorpha TaxID=45954 RepID=A0A9D3Y4A0_DREPO|nr:hypothetical protein DPMN_191680 [Dreissena polymorpha]